MGGQTIAGPTATRRRAARGIYCVHCRCKEECRCVCTCGVEAKGARSASASGKREDSSGGSSGLAVSHPRSVLAPSRARRSENPPPHPSAAHNKHLNTHLPSASAPLSSHPPSYIVARCRPLRRPSIQRIARGAALLPLGRARSPPHFYLRLRDPHGLDSLSPHCTAQRLHHHQQKHGQS